MKLYRYPDFDDTLFEKFFTKFEQDEAYWNKSEQTIIKIILMHLKKKPEFTFNNYLDAGSGQGRLLPEFEQHFRHITAIEPDPERFYASLNKVKELAIDHKTILKNISAELFFSKTRYDFILCSHVLQHIHTDIVSPLIQNLCNHLSDHGVIALTTCHSNESNDIFYINYLGNGTPIKEVVGKEKFNTLTNCKDGLPIHYFNADKLISELEDIGLKTTLFRVFHVSKEDRNILQQPDIDSYINSSLRMQQQYGIDMLLLLEKG
ncbi:MAG: methyltransferase domain-containing protein [Bacteroidales bacterium]|nr:methyltransferase domain-containing protein [Bacteroidales bacterium]